jgi:hypothetical protein
MFCAHIYIFNHFVVKFRFLIEFRPKFLTQSSLRIKNSYMPDFQLINFLSTTTIRVQDIFSFNNVV